MDNILATLSLCATEVHFCLPLVPPNTPWKYGIIKSQAE